MEYDIKYILYLVAAITALIGTLYRIHATQIKENRDNIKKNDEKADARLDIAEKDIVSIKGKIKL